MSLMNKLARKIVKAQRSPGAVSGSTRREPTATGGRPVVTTQPTAGANTAISSYQKPEGPQIAGLTTRGTARTLHSRPVKRPKGLKYGGRI